MKLIQKHSNAGWRRLFVLCGSLAVGATSLALGAGGYFSQSPHGSATDGVYRTSAYPRGNCAQCHATHDISSAYPYGLFRENSNELCFSASQGGCHADQPTGASSGYPAQESDRMPYGSADPGYFEANSGGARLPGPANRVRWPGRQVWENSQSSPHYASPNMPGKDAFGNGACSNCHAVHGSAAPHDMLDTTYSGITNAVSQPQASNLVLCLTCHSTSSSVSMPQEARYIADYYDRSLNPGMQSGHGVNRTEGYVTNGARLPCYDCHNPHGSQGYGNLGANGFLLSDQRQGWYGLDSITTSNVQVRRFCFGCHKSSDGLLGGTVEGMVLPALSSDVPDHVADTTGTRHCYDCHGRDYSTSSSRNVHNPSDGNSSGQNIINTPGQN